MRVDPDEDDYLRYTLQVNEGDRIFTDPREVFQTLGMYEDDIVEYFREILVGEPSGLEQRARTYIDQLMEAYIEKLVEEGYE